VRSLVALAGDLNPRIGRAAVASLGRLFGFDPTIKSQVRDPLTALAARPDRHLIVRREAVNQLGRICRANDFADRGTIRTLVRVAKPSGENPPGLNAAALRALGNIGDPQGRQAIRDGLEVISGHSMGPDADAWEDWVDENKASLRARGR
jgi:HEAT repeat protein